MGSTHGPGVARLRRVSAPEDWTRYAVDRRGVMLGTIERRGPLAEWWVVIAADGEVLPRARAQVPAMRLLCDYADGRVHVVNAGEHPPSTPVENPGDRTK